LIYPEKNEIRQINNSLLNSITPSGGVEFQRNRGWAAKISTLLNVITVQIFEPANNNDLLSDLSKSVAKCKGVMMSTRDELERQRAERAVEDAERLITQIDQHGEIIGYMSNLVVVVARDEQSLERSCRQLEATIATLN